MMDLAVQLGTSVVAVVAVTFFLRWRMSRRRSSQKATVVGGLSQSLQTILQSMPLLASCPIVDLPGILQIIVYAVQMQWQEWRCDSKYEFVVEKFLATLPGESTEGFSDHVQVKWLHGLKGCKERNLPPDAPIVILTPGLNCYAANLPGTAIYAKLLEKPWRVGVYEKRGVGDAGSRLKAPVFHMFGHTSDLHVVVKEIVARWPDAPLHLLGMSSGNGLSSSYLSIHGPDVPNLKSCLLLIGGEDYNMAFTPPLGNWLTRLVLDKVLLATSKDRMLKRNEAVLRPHNASAFDAGMCAQTGQEFYDICMQNFSGYKNREEAERRINAFSSGKNECMLDYKVPCLVCFTEDDPVAPGGPRSSWVEVIKKCDNAALALFPTGTHLACYDSWSLSRWVDKLAIEWLEAVHSVTEN